jgi:hypothetical protein
MEPALFPNMHNPHANKYLYNFCAASFSLNVQRLHLMYGKMSCMTDKGELNYCQGNG